MTIVTSSYRPKRVLAKVAKGLQAVLLEAQRLNGRHGRIIGGKLRDTKLEELPTLYLLVSLAFFSLLALGVGGRLVKPGADWVFWNFQYLSSLDDVIEWVRRIVLLLLLALLFLVYLTFSMRLLKVLGERWFP